MANHHDGIKTLSSRANSLFRSHVGRAHDSHSYYSKYFYSHRILALTQCLLLTLIALIFLPRYRLTLSFAIMPHETDENQTGGRVLTRAQRARGDNDDTPTAPLPIPASSSSASSQPINPPIINPSNQPSTSSSDRINQSSNQQPSSSSSLTVNTDTSAQRDDNELDVATDDNAASGSSGSRRQSRNVQRRMSNERRSRSPSPTRLPFNQSRQRSSDDADADARAGENANNSALTDDDETEDYDIGFSVSPPKIFKKNAAIQFRARPTHSDADYAIEISKFRNAYVDFLRRQREERYPRGFKTHLSTCVKFDVVKNDEIVDSPIPNFTSKSRIIVAEDDIEERIEPQLQSIENQISDFKERGSGFIYHAVLDWTITLCSYQPFVVGTHIRTPMRIKMIKATINVEPSGEEDKNWCFVDSVSAVLHPVANNAQRAAHYRHYRSGYNLKGLQLPLTIKQTRAFERRNDTLSINIFGIEEKSTRADGAPIFFPLSISDNRGADKKTVNLLLLQRGKESHFLAIRDLARLTRRIKSKNQRHTVVCNYCLQHFSTKAQNADKIFRDHQNFCAEHSPMTTSFPPEGAKLEFRRIDATEKNYYTLYLDFETYEKGVSGAANADEEPLEDGDEKRYEWCSGKRSLNHLKTCRKCLPFKPCDEWERSLQLDANLKLFSWAYLIDSTDPAEKYPLRLYQGENPEETFFRTLKEDALMINQQLRKQVPLKWTAADRAKHDAATQCEACQRPFSTSDASGDPNSAGVKCADHDHRYINVSSSKGCWFDSHRSRSFFQGSFLIFT